MNYNVHDAKSQLSKLIEQALAGEEVVIANRGKPVVKLVPIVQKSGIDSILGALSHVELKPGWDDPMTGDELSDWYEGSDEALVELGIEKPSEPRQ